jgi:hypothetical protein
LRVAVAGLGFSCAAVDEWEANFDEFCPSLDVGDGSLVDGDLLPVIGGWLLIDGDKHLVIRDWLPIIGDLLLVERDRSLVAGN